MGQKGEEKVHPTWSLSMARAAPGPGSTTAAHMHHLSSLWIQAGSKQHQEPKASLQSSCSLLLQKISAALSSLLSQQGQFEGTQDLHSERKNFIWSSESRGETSSKLSPGTCSWDTNLFPLTLWQLQCKPKQALVSHQDWVFWNPILWRWERVVLPSSLCSLPPHFRGNTKWEALGLGTAKSNLSGLAGKKVKSGT